ncbi:insulinase family protein [Sulfurimonas aquatica]|uniref:Insulinase family protein n=2 Tax=Sulfurimonas aquatica TaxID=2672570 RepID=A0A975GDZ7_9BACT|nr:insulinase family protein [Sulfurimonas aquatica]
MAAKIDTIEVNGIKVPFIFEEDKRLPLVTAQIVFTNSGSIADTKKAGLAKFSAKLLNEGTKKLGSNAFAETLESKAISISAHSGTETFVMEMSSLKDEFKNGLGYLSALLSDPNYSDESMSKIKTMTLGMLSSKENDFDYIASNELKSLLFKDTVLSHPTSGTVESVKSIKLNDVKGFIQNHLVLSRAIVVVGGDVDVKDVKKKIAKLLSVLPMGKSEALSEISVAKKPQESILKKETEQAYIYFGSPYNIQVDSEDFYKARVAIYILGTGGFGSRLMEEIRVKRGLAYSAYARVHVSKSHSYMTGYLQTKLDSMDEAKKTVEDVIADFVKKGVKKEELEQTKKFLLGSEPLRVETMSQRLNRTFMEYYKGFELGHSSVELEKIQNLQLKDLNEYIKSHKEILDLSFAIVTK